MYKYRITKYNPQYRDDKDIFMKNEWTSYTDIGKIYNEHIFLKEEYLSIVNQKIKELEEAAKD